MENQRAPEILPPILENIPAEMRKNENYVCYRAPEKQKADGSWKRDKIPIDPKTCRNASSKDPSTWGSFEAAVDLFKRREDIAGIGFQFRHEFDISAIDIDNCIENGVVDPVALKIIEDFDSYTELSPSGTGIHIFFLGTDKSINSVKYPNAYEDFGIELFSSRFFSTVTGIPIPGYKTCGNLQHRARKYKALYTQLKQKNEKIATDGTRPKGLADVDDFEKNIISKVQEKGYSPGDRRVTRGEKDKGWMWECDCPWKEEHTGGTDRGGIFYYGDGMPGWHCFHSHCAQKTWKHFAEKLGLPKPSFIDEYCRGLV